MEGQGESDGWRSGDRARHPQPTAEQQATVDYHLRRIPHIAKAVSKAMVMFPPAGGDLPRRPRLARPGGRNGSTRRESHDWVYVEGRWRRTRCWTYSLGAEIPVSRRSQTCDGDRVTVAMRKSEALGHTMLYAEGELPIAYCSRCGGWSSRRAQHLARRCAPPTANGKAALRRIALGLHPWRAKDKATGSDCPRSRLSAVARGGPPSRRDIEHGRGGGDAGGEPIRERCGHDDDVYVVHGNGDADTPVHDEMVLVPEEEHDVFGHGGSLEEDAQDRREVAIVSDEGRVGCGKRRHGDDGDEREMTLLDEEGRDPRVRGTSLGMVATMLQDAETARRKGRRMPYGEGRWAIYNQTTGQFVTTTVAALEAEQVSLIRDFNADARAAMIGAKRRRMGDGTVDGSSAGAF